MKATIDLEIQPFEVPFTVRIIPPEPCEGTTGTLKIEDMTVETLARLCDQFRDSVFEKAGKQDPAVPHPRPFEFPPNSPRLRRDDRMTTPSFPGDIKRNQRPTTDAPIHHPPYTVTWCGTGVPRNPMTGCKDD
jgi:hypothetical protein